MATANLQETVQLHILRRNELQLENTTLSNQRRLAVYAQADKNSELALGKQAIRDKYKQVWEEDYKPILETDKENCDCKYKCYEDIPGYEEEIELLEAKFQDELADLSAWETSITEQITVNDIELKEVQAYLASYQEMLKTNISNDFSFGLNQ